MTKVDVTPGAHDFDDAVGTVSFKLACGCTVPPSEPDTEVFLFKRAGSEYPCSKHGTQYITRSTVRLLGWHHDPMKAEIRKRLKGKQVD